jgi:hypothetical protein
MNKSQQYLYSSKQVFSKQILEVEVEKVSAVLSLDEPGRKPAEWIDMSIE